MVHRPSADACVLHLQNLGHPIGICVSPSLDSCTAEMLQLPVELRRLCLQPLSTNVAPSYGDEEDRDENRDALQAMRLVNKELGTLATEILFRKAVLNHTDESAERFLNVLRSDLSRLVHHVIVNTSDDPEASSDGQEPSEVAESFEEAMAVVHEFRTLEHMELRFANQCALELDADDFGWEKEVAETTGYRVEILQGLFASLRKAEKVRTLTLKNLQDYHRDDFFVQEDFKAVRERITKLHLQIATEDDEAAPEHTISKEGLHQGFTIALPNIWLKPMTQQLTHLTLFAGECLWGVWPYVNFRDVPPFPHLKSLSFGNLTIAHDWQVDWITAHGSSLEELLLDDCYIVTSLHMGEEEVGVNFPDHPPHPDAQDQWLIHVPLRWSAVFDRFRADLTRLNRFAIGHGTWNFGRAFDERYELVNKLVVGRYCMFDSGMGPSPWGVAGEGYEREKHEFSIVTPCDVAVSFPECGDEDGEALKELIDVINARADTKT
jgi:hypothetical protein